MKQIANFQNGAVTITEENGVFKLNVDESFNVGGGEASGIVKVSGKASVQLDAELALKLGENLLNSMLPPTVLPLAKVIEGVVNQAIESIE